MLTDALREFNAALDDVAASLGFLRSATKLRPRLGAILNWQVHGEPTQLAKEFINQKGVEETVLYRGMVVVLSGALEAFVRRIVRDVVIEFNRKTSVYDELDESVAVQNIFRTGQALQTVFEPLDHLDFDYELLCRNLGTCCKGVSSFTLNADAFSMYISSVAPNHLVEVMKRIGVSLEWDHLGQDAQMQKLFNKGGARETAKAIQSWLSTFVKTRNKISHGGTGGVLVTQADIEQMLVFFRLFSKVLSSVIQTNVQKRMRDRSVRRVHS